MGLFDSFTGNKNPQTTDTDAPIITETAEVSPVPEVSLDPQTIQIQDTDILGGYTPSTEISVETPIETTPTSQTSDNASDILITPDIQIDPNVSVDVPTNTEISSIDPIVTEPGEGLEMPQITLDTPVVGPEISMNSENDSSLLDTPSLTTVDEETQIPETTGTSLFDSLDSTDAEISDISPAIAPSLDTQAMTLGTATALTMDDAIKTLKANLKTIEDSIKDRKKANADAIKETKEAKADAIKKADDTLKELEKEKAGIESDEKRLEEMEHNLLGTKKTTRRTTRKRTTRSRRTPSKTSTSK